MKKRIVKKSQLLLFPKPIKEIAPRSEKSPSTEVGIIPLIYSTPEIMLPDPNWLSRMKRVNTLAVEYFSSLMKIYGYVNFEDMCLHINTSFPIIERFLNKWDVPFTEEAKITIEVLQCVLDRAFKKMESGEKAMAW